MKKTKSCIALICAVVMLMTAFVVVPVTANAEGQKASTSEDIYPRLTRATTDENGEYKETTLSPDNGSASHIWTNKDEVIISATLTVNGKVSSKDVMIGKEGDKYYWNIKTKD